MFGVEGQEIQSTGLPKEVCLALKFLPSIVLLDFIALGMPRGA
jgi:hypothetical protein